MIETDELAERDARATELADRIAAAQTRERDATTSLALAGFRGGQEVDMLGVLSRLRLIKALFLARGWVADAAEWDALEAEARAAVVEDVVRQARLTGAVERGRTS